jgi:hypothetical protein
VALSEKAEQEQHDGGTRGTQRLHHGGMIAVDDQDHDDQDRATVTGMLAIAVRCWSEKSPPSGSDPNLQT